MELGLYRRLIELDLRNRTYTARFDADSAELLSISPNFVY